MRDNPRGAFDDSRVFLRGPVLLFSLDITESEPTVIYTTPNVEEFLGFTQEEILRKKVTLHRLIHPADYKKIAARIRYVKENKEVEFIETNYRLIKKDGEIRYMKAYSFVERDQKKNPIYFHGYLMDIHEAEIYKRQLEHVIEGADLGYWIWDLKSGRHTVNDRWLNMLGLSRDDIKNDISDWEERVHPKDLKKIKPLLRDHIKKGTIYNAEFRMRHKDGRWIWIYSSGGVVEYSHESGEPLLMCGTHQDITQRKMTENRIKHLAYHDPLTSLPNRALLFDRIKQAIFHSKRAKKLNALIFIDLDNFKSINDFLGHKAGDTLLKSLSRRLLKSVRSEDTVARLGGDEFSILLIDLDAKKAQEYAYLVAEKILRQIKKPFYLERQKFYINASIGIVIFPEEEHGECYAQEVVKRADAAMYHAKAMGKGKISFYDKELNEKTKERLIMQIHMKEALKDGEFEVNYQPIVESSSEKIIGVEALLRWKRGDEIFYPSEFIPIAEENSMIEEINRFVVEEVCKDLADENLEKRYGKIEFVSINISTTLFKYEDLHRSLLDTISDHKVDFSRFNFELTESVLLEDFEDSVEKIESMKRLGVRFSLDDFGTGYSSLTYLRRLPVDYVKIDKEFLKNVDKDGDNAKIVEVILDISKHFGFKVIAEGIEDRDQFEHIKKLGCDFAQGYLFGRPESI